MVKIKRVLISSLFLVASSFSLLADRAEACCSYVFWYQPGTTEVFRDVVGFEQAITPLESTGDRKNYWATQWSWTNVSDGGYMGVQTYGVQEDEVSAPGPVALFSIWGATSAIAGANARCRPFDWEGVGILCRLDLPTVLTKNNFVVERSLDGKSWSAQVQQPGGNSELIGTITLGEVSTMWNIHSWVEYFGSNNETRCSELPGSAVTLGFPKFKLRDGTSATKSKAVFSTRTCIRSTMVETVAGQEVFLAQGQWTLATPTTTTTTTTTTVAPITATVKPIVRTIGSFCKTKGTKAIIRKKVATCMKIGKVLRWKY